MSNIIVDPCLCRPIAHQSHFLVLIDVLLLLEKHQNFSALKQQDGEETENWLVM